jgi:hypothetical protein
MFLPLAIMASLRPYDAFAQLLRFFYLVMKSSCMLSEKCYAQFKDGYEPYLTLNNDEYDLYFRATLGQSLRSWACLTSITDPWLV